MIKINSKKVMLLLCTILVVFVCIGCTSAINAKDANPASLLSGQKIAKIEVLSAADNHLLKTIDDTSILDEFAKKAIFSEDTSAFETSSADCKPSYIFVVYKKSAVAGSTDVEKIYSLTTYADTDTVRLQISPDVVKNMKIPADLLSFDYKLSDDVIKYLNSFITA